MSICGGSVGVAERGWDVEKKKKRTPKMNMKYSTDVKEGIHTHKALMMKDSTADKTPGAQLLWDTRNAADTEIYCILEWTFSILLWVPIYSLIRHPLRLTGRERLELLQWELNPNLNGEQLTCRYEYLQSRYRLPRWQAGNISKMQQGRCANSQPAAQQSNEAFRAVPSCRITARLHDFWNAALQLSFGNDFLKMCQKL